MMRRNDLRTDPRFATANLRRQNLPALLAEVKAWLSTFSSLEQLQAQVSEAGLAVGVVRTIGEFAGSEWVKEWGAVVEVDDRAGGTVRMPGNPWIFSRSVLPPPGVPAFQGEHNEEILAERKISPGRIKDLQKRKVLLSRRSPVGTYD
jgi:crotonobetainyl-CoA:carnitine CoA-transferase CaiB-like acyl-CoA transferase